MVSQTELSVFIAFVLLITGSVTAKNLPGISQAPGHSQKSLVEPLCSEPGCNFDLHLYCLSNGLILMGSCSLKIMLCTNGIRNSLWVENNIEACLQTKYIMEHASKQSSQQQSDEVANYEENQRDKQVLNLEGRDPWLYHSEIKSDLSNNGVVVSEDSLANNQKKDEAAFGDMFP